MATIVEATVPAEEFALGNALSQGEDTTVRAVRLVAHEFGRPIPLLLARGDDVDRIHAAIRTDPLVREVSVLRRFDDGSLLDVDWGPRVQIFRSILDDAGAQILDLAGHDGVWHVQIYLGEHHSRSTLEQSLAESGFDVSFDSADDRSLSAGPGYYGLTECQYETVRFAYEQGYYDVPRTVTQTDIADDLGVSHQALSERLRRAHETLVTDALYLPTHQRTSPESQRVHIGVDS